MAAAILGRPRKKTFSLHAYFLRAIDQMVKHGVAKSSDAVIEQALVHEFQRYRQERRAEAMRLALQDPAFLKDIEIIEAEFAAADNETLRDAV